MYKTMIFILCLLCMSTSSVCGKDKKKSQSRKQSQQKFARAGTWMVSGSFNYSALSDSDSGRSMLPFTPTFGYTLLDNTRLAFALLASINYQSVTQEADLDLNSQSNEILIDPVLYWRGLAHLKLYPFAHIGLGYYTQSQDRIEFGLGKDDLDEVVTDSASGYIIKSGLGINYALGQKEGGFAQLQVDYVYTGLTDYQAQPARGFNWGGLDVSLGLGLFF